MLQGKRNKKLEEETIQGGPTERPWEKLLRRVGTLFSAVR